MRAWCGASPTGLRQLSQPVLQQAPAAPLCTGPCGGCREMGARVKLRRQPCLYLRVTDSAEGCRACTFGLRVLGGQSGHGGRSGFPGGGLPAKLLKPSGSVCDLLPPSIVAEPCLWGHSGPRIPFNRSGLFQQGSTGPLSRGRTCRFCPVFLRHGASCLCVCVCDRTWECQV